MHCIAGNIARQYVHGACERVELFEQLTLNFIYLPRSVAAKQSGSKPGLLPNLGTDAGTYVQDIPLWHQWLEAPRQASHKTSSAKLLISKESGYMHAWQQNDTSLNIC